MPSPCPTAPLETDRSEEGISLYWWRVPEMPEVGVGMLRVVTVWFLPVVALPFVIMAIIPVVS